MSEANTHEYPYCVTRVNLSLIIEFGKSQAHSIGLYEKFMSSIAKIHSHNINLQVHI